MNDKVKETLKTVLAIVVIATVISLILWHNKSYTAKNKKKLTTAIAAGEKVKIGGYTWRVRTYNATNGKCYKVHSNGHNTFVIPCE